MITINRTTRFTAVSRNNGDVNRAIAEIDGAARLGVGAPGDRTAGAVGRVRVTSLTSKAGKPWRVGAVNVTTKYRCDRNDRLFLTRKACEAACGGKSTKPPPPPPSSPPVRDVINDLQRRLRGLPKTVGGNCSEWVMVKMKYVVPRDYVVDVEVYRLLWMVLVDNMPETGRQVREWNQAIADHEEHHVEDVERAARNALPPEQTYEVSGEGASRSEAEDEAWKDLMRKVFADAPRIERAFVDRMKRESFHTDRREIPLPRFAR